MKTFLAATASLKSSLARVDVSRFAAEPLTGLRLSSLAEDSAGRDADALESDAVTELTVLTVLFFWPFGGGGGAGIFLACIGITGCAMDSLSDEEETSNVFFCFSTDFFIEFLNLSRTSARSRSTRSSSEVFGGPRDRSFGVEVSRTGLVVLALAWRKLLRNGAT